MLHAQWPQCVTHGVQISTVGAPDRHTGSPYCLPHKTERKTEHLRAALLAPSSTKLPTHLFPLSFLWPSTSNIKRGENNGTLKAMSHCLQKEHIWIALHIEIYLKKKKNASQTFLLCSINLNFKFGIQWLIWKLGSSLSSKRERQKSAQTKVQHF